ncbi:MAG: ZIP family metal transporter [Elusimicrobia bacterium]|nr:ZIP family metal transporter [Elusimicrobiota bacterium]
MGASASLLIFNATAVGATFVGGWVPTAKAFLSRAGMQRMFSLRAGILIGVTFTGILPEAWKLQPTWAGWGALAAFTLLLLMETFAMVDSCPEYLEECDVHALSWTALAALASHSFLDGFNLGVSFSAGESAGAAVGLALTLHKVADGFTLTTLFQQAGYSPRQSAWGLFLVALATPLGALVSAAGAPSFDPGVAAGVLGFAGGSFLYIAASDLLRRIHRGQDRLSLLYFMVGLLGMAALQAH